MKTQVNAVGIFLLTSFFFPAWGSPSWSFYSGADKKWVDFKFDEKKSCVDGKVNKARSDEERAKLSLVPKDVQKELMPMFAASTDNRKFVETNKMFCQLSLNLVNTKCDFDKLKIVSRVAKFKKNMPNEPADGGSYITHMAIYGCDKAGSETPEECVYSKATEEKKKQQKIAGLGYPMTTEAYQNFIQDCYFALFSIGRRYDADIKRVDAKSVVDPMLDGHTAP